MDGSQLLDALDWAQYAVTLEVYADRANETRASLWLRGMNQPRLSFLARTKGQQGWSQFHTSGDTPTGLYAIDLQTPFENHKSFGKWPVNRLVAGLVVAGRERKPTNAQVVRNAYGADVRNTTMRSGLLMHTGEWAGWTPQKPMPNSEGCIHIHPDACEEVAAILQGHGVEARPNSNGALPYPYKPQGVLSLSLVR